MKTTKSHTKLDNTASVIIISFLIIVIALFSLFYIDGNNQLSEARSKFMDSCNNLTASLNMPYADLVIRDYPNVICCGRYYEYETFVSSINITISINIIGNISDSKLVWADVNTLDELTLWQQQHPRILWKAENPEFPYPPDVYNPIG